MEIAGGESGKYHLAPLLELGLVLKESTLSPGPTPAVSNDFLSLSTLREFFGVYDKASRTAHMYVVREPLLVSATPSARFAAEEGQGMACVSSITLKNGRTIYAADYGHKCFPIGGFRNAKRRRKGSVKRKV